MWNKKDRAKLSAVFFYIDNENFYKFYVF